MCGLVAGLLLACAPTAARDVDDRGDGEIFAVSLEQLPGEARETLRLIHAGGPFVYARDGIIFGNREHLLPHRPRARRLRHRFAVGTGLRLRRAAGGYGGGFAARAPRELNTALEVLEQGAKFWSGQGIPFHVLVATPAAGGALPMVSTP